MKVLKIMPSIYQVRLSSPLANRLMSLARELGAVEAIRRQRLGAEAEALIVGMDWQ